jgi:hypothetical protein
MNQAGRDKSKIGSGSERYEALYTEEAKFIVRRTIVAHLKCLKIKNILDNFISGSGFCAAN